MKKYLLFFSLFVFHFSFCTAQDTLVFKTGDKVAVKIIYVGEQQVLYTIPKEERQLWVMSKELNVVKYADGKSYSFIKVRKIKDSMRRVENRDYGLVNINAGIGVSIITFATGGNALFGGNIHLLSESPACNFTIDYNFTNYFTIGLAGSYQFFTDNPNSDEYLSNNYAFWEAERITRKTFALRFSYSILLKGRHNCYAGVRAGESFWTDRIISYTAPTPPPGYGGYPEYTTMAGSEQRLSFQLFAGYRYFLSNNIGFHAELGIGTPYFAEAGITFRFKTKRIEK